MVGWMFQSAIKFIFAAVGDVGLFIDDNCYWVLRRAFDARYNRSTGLSFLKISAVIFYADRNCNTMEFRVFCISIEVELVSCFRPLEP